VITRVTFRLPKAWQPLTGYADLAAELDRGRIAIPPDAPADRRSGDRASAAASCPIRRFCPTPAASSTTRWSMRGARRTGAAYPDLPRYPQPDGRVKLAAGWLIEQSGWKGRDLGRVGMYEKQALVLVNRGGAHGAEVIALAKAVQADVRERFGVELTPEPVPSSSELPSPTARRGQPCGFFGPMAHGFLLAIRPGVHRRQNTSSGRRKRHCPSGRSPSLTAPMRTRLRPVTRSPTSSHMRRICRFRPRAARSEADRR
jgi:hypothetical protein